MLLLLLKRSQKDPLNKLQIMTYQLKKVLKLCTKNCWQHCNPASPLDHRTPPIQNRFRNSSATILALAFTANFISDTSLSISSMKWITKSTNLCLYICSVWKLVIRKLISYPFSGFRLKTIKFSARIIMNRINFLQRIFSISSACFTAMLIRTELIELSMRTFSFSLRDITTGVMRSSRLVLTSTSGLLWRSTTCEEKFSKHMAAVRVWRTAVK